VIFLSSFQPRAENTAKKVIFGLTTVGAGTTALFTGLFPTAQTRPGAALTIVGCLLIIALAGAMVARKVCPLWMWVAYPFAAVAVIAVLDLGSHDASLTAQIFFVFPVLYAGAQLRRPAAMAVCGAAIAANLGITLAGLPWPTAVVDASFLAVVVIAATALLVVAGERNDMLIAELEHQAAIDPLTGLVTRRVLDRVASAALQGAASNVGTAMLLVDLDRFKQVNDVHGHPAGDAVLQQLAGVLIAVNRRTDVISRMGGDEIAVFMPSCPLDFALRRADQILHEVRSCVFDISAHTMLAASADRCSELRLSVSIGVAHLPTHGTDLRQLYAAADLSLYGAKTGGRDRVGPVPDMVASSDAAAGPAPVHVSRSTGE
jgi:diguanylate cyclase (GGDEF)-like protein